MPSTRPSRVAHSSHSLIQENWLSPPMLAVANGGADDRRLQAGERALQQLVVAGAGRASDAVRS